MGVNATVLNNLKKIFGFDRPTDIQAKTIPVALMGKDVFGKAGTGQGKTLAFLVPVVHTLLSRAAPPARIRAVIVSPTRELANQTYGEAVKLCTGTALRVALVIGGVKARQLEQTDILVATPGRLVDMLKTQPGLRDRLTGTEVLVLDEADRLLDQGFLRDIKTIVGAMPPPGKRLGLLFSATVPEEVMAAAATMLAPGTKLLDVISSMKKNDEAGPSKLQQEYVVVSPGNVAAALGHVLWAKSQERPDHKIIVFVPTKGVVDLIAGQMRACLGRPVLSLHSGMNQSQRERAIDELRRAKRGAIAVATDVIARGIDIDDITLVVQVGYVDRETYVHRAGRTARAGRGGEALLITTPEESRMLADIMSTVPLRPSAPGSKVSGALGEGMPGPKCTLPADMKAKGNRALRTMLGAYKGHAKQLGWTDAQMKTFVTEMMSGFGV
jgi:superfamily II DNA/RNA helicase